MEESSIDNTVALDPMPPYRRLLSSTYLKNNVLVFGAGIFSGVGSYLQHPLMIAILGLAGYKSVVSLVALSTIFLLPTQILGTVITRFAATLSAEGKFGELNDFVRRLTALMLTVGGIFALVFILASGQIAAFLHVGSVQPVIVLGISFIVAFAGPVNNAALQGLQLFSWSAPLSVLPLALRLLLIVLFVRLGLSIEGAVAAITLSAIISYVVSFQPLRPLLRTPRIPLGSLRPLLSYSVTAILAAIGNALVFQTDIVLAGHFLTPVAAGLYAAVATLGKMVLFISSSLTIVLFPRAAALHQRGENIVGVVMQSFFAMLALSAAVEFVFIIIPLPVIHVLYRSLDPTQAAVAAGQLPWYGLAMFLFAPTQALMTYFLAVNDRVFAFIVLACSALQAFLIIVRHQTLTDVVQAVIISIAWMLVALLALFIIRTRRSYRSRVPHA